VSAAALQARDVRFSFGAHEVLRGVSLDLPAASILFLMGVNGCGKTTFIDCILGTNRIGSGSLLVLGDGVESLSPVELARRVAFVPQMHHLSFPYSVRQVVLMGRTAHLGGLGILSAEDQELVDEALELCGIAHLAKRPYTTLSGGEVQMVLLARALAQASPLVVLDEPTAHLDFRNEMVFLETVARLVRERSLSVLMASHAPNQAFYLADSGLDVQVALMQDGVVRRLMAPHETLTVECLREGFGVDALILEASCESAGRPRRVTQIAPIGLYRKE
jgi:iron complex transport system ATP-binding protein